MTDEKVRTLDKNEKISKLKKWQLFFIILTVFSLVNQATRGGGVTSEGVLSFALSYPFAFIGGASLMGSVMATLGIISDFVLIWIIVLISLSIKIGRLGKPEQK